MQITLAAEQIIATIDVLAKRTGERFPVAGLRQIAEDFTHAARDMRKDAGALARANWRLRPIARAITRVSIALCDDSKKQLQRAFKTSRQKAESTLATAGDPAS